MESLHLPIEMLWEGKLEPLSPSHVASTSFEEFVFEDDFAEDISNDDGVFLNNKLYNIDKLQEILLLNEESQEDLYLEDQWLNSRADTPIAPDYLTQPVGLYPVKTTINSTPEDIYLEFESIYDPVEYTHLTPPQTPPEFTKSFTEQNLFSSSEELSNTFHQPSNVFVTSVKGGSKSVNNAFQNPAMVSEELLPIVFDENDLARELELVEELIRSRSKEQATDHNTFDEDSFSGGSSTSGSCPVSPRSDTPFSESKTSNDDDWYPEAKTSSKRKSKPYARTTEDRKSRKKEQNKNAATRYRQKKKQEVEEILGEEKVLRDINKTLQTSYNDVKREIKYLKNLLRELYQVKGGLNN